MHPIVTALQARLAANPVSEDVTGQPFEPCPPASPAEVASSEAELGFALPPLLRQLYLDVANGGFGPGYGVMGLEDGFTDDQGSSAVSLYQTLAQKDPDAPDWHWPERWLPFCYWGCTVYSLVHCEPPYPVAYIDLAAIGEDEEVAEYLIAHKATLDEWFKDWLAGKDLWQEAWG
ncbi:SMI1/KNR4 family protein [Chitinimonas lacunae]|uniref:SMI1/KNR4 family protein n=1 Tax=Chitinimonas lacunae TaxID=1963018 RepID=A0ABV8MT85_9NEIS